MLFFPLRSSEKLQSDNMRLGTISMGKSINSIIREQLLLGKTKKTAQKSVEKLGVLQHLRLSSL